MDVPWQAVLAAGASTLMSAALAFYMSHRLMSLRLRESDERGAVERARAQLLAQEVERLKRESEMQQQRADRMWREVTARTERYEDQLQAKIDKLHAAMAAGDPPQPEPERVTGALRDATAAEMGKPVARLQATASTARHIAHSMAGPMSTIDRGLQMLGHVVDTDRHAAGVRRIAHGLELARDVINAYASLGLQGDASQGSRVDLVSELPAAFELAVLGQEKTVNLRFDIMPGLSMPEDRYRILLVALLAIVENAIEAVDDNGIVDVDINEADAMLRVCVHDTGPGMGERAGRVLKEGYTTKLHHRGLGLAAAKDLVTNALGGRLWCDDHPDGGARFYVEVKRHA